MTSLTDHFEKTFEKGGFTYVSWSQVADRLDEASPGWNFSIVNIIGPDCVHGRLTLGDGRGFENVGYAENADKDWKHEALKDAVSDAFKRCAALAGVARYLYDKDAPTTHAAPSLPSRPAAPSRPTSASSASGGELQEPEHLRDAFYEPRELPVAPQGAIPGGECPMHHLAWVLKPGGTSKTTGKDYDPFWACPSNERPFCKEKPSKAWQARQEVA